jgi:predicted HicB family RNase H-like nuclease
MAGKPQGDIEMDATINFRISQRLKDMAEKAAKSDRRTLAQWIRLIIEKELSRKH